VLALCRSDAGAGWAAARWYLGLSRWGPVGHALVTAQILGPAFRPVNSFFVSDRKKQGPTGAPLSIADRQPVARTMASPWPGSTAATMASPWPGTVPAQCRALLIRMTGPWSLAQVAMMPGSVLVVCRKR
jgi:hypothetical protein